MRSALHDTARTAPPTATALKFALGISRSIATRLRSSGPCGSGTPRTSGNWPTIMWIAMPARKPMVTGADKRSAIHPARRRAATTRRTPLNSATTATNCGYCAALATVSSALRKDRRDRRIRPHRNVAVCAEHGKGERAGGERVETRLSRHTCQVRRGHLFWDTDGGQHYARDDVAPKPRRPIAMKRDEDRDHRYRRLVNCNRRVISLAHLVRFYGRLRIKVQVFHYPATCDTTSLRTHLWYAGVSQQSASIRMKVC